MSTQIYFVLAFALVVSVSAQSNYTALAPAIAPSNYSGFFESLTPFYIGCKFFYNSILTSTGLNSNFVNGMF